MDRSPSWCVLLDSGSNSKPSVFPSQLFVYTCAKKEYAEKILNILDPKKKLFRYVHPPPLVVFITG